MPEGKGNALFTIRPYCDHGTWMFDDPDRDIYREALVSGMPEIIQFATQQAGISNPEEGFTVIFSEHEFPTAQVRLVRTQLCEGGHSAWYQMEGTNLEGWLCPCLERFFSAPPENIYVQVAP